MAFTQVTREKSKLRLALAGPSGAGKTLSALTYGLWYNRRLGKNCSY